MKARLREEVHKTVPVHYANSCIAALSEKARGDCLIQFCSLFDTTLKVKRYFSSFSFNWLQKLLLQCFPSLQSVSHGLMSHADEGLSL